MNSGIWSFLVSFLRLDQITPGAGIGVVILLQAWTHLNCLLNSVISDQNTPGDVHVFQFDGWGFQSSEVLLLSFLLRLLESLLMLIFIFLKRV